MSEIRTDTINNASGDNDSGIDLSTNDQVKIKTANTTALTVDSSQNVGIGTSSPDELLELSSSSPKIKITDTNNTIGQTGLVANISAEDSAGTATWVIGREFGSTALKILNKQASATIFETGGSESMRIDSSGNFLVGKTSVNVGTIGHELRGGGPAVFTRDSDTVVFVNRESSDGELIQLRKDDATIGGIYSSPSITGPFIGHINVGLAMYHNGNSVLPSGTGGLRDNAIDLGNGSNRFDDIFATNTTIQTSDRNEKQDIEELSEAEQRVAVVAKGLMRKYRWRDAVAEKGDNARTHFGIIAQDLQDAFTAEGLDASDYAMFCSDTWWEKEISVDAVEADEENGIEAKDAYTYRKIAEEATEGYTEKTRLGVRYNELLAFIISAL